MITATKTDSSGPLANYNFGCVWLTSVVARGGPESNL